MKSRHFRPPLRIHGFSLLFLAFMLPLGPLWSGDWRRHVIDPADAKVHRSGADGVKTGDLDGDGRLDLVTGWEEGCKVRVCLHPGPAKVREPWPAITVGEVKSPEDAVFADLDGDGRLDVVSACEGSERKLHVHWAPAAPLPLTAEAAWTTTGFLHASLAQWWMQVLPHDVDGDGDPDLIAGSKNTGGSVTWLENPGGASSRDLGKWIVHPVAQATWIMSLELVGLQMGGHLVYSDRKGEGSGIWVAPLLPRTPWIGEPARVAAAGEEVMFLSPASIDGDGRIDLVAAIRPDAVRVYSQPEDPAAPWPQILDLAPLPADRFGSVKAAGLVDTDGDGVTEFAITCENAKGPLCGVLLASRDSVWDPVGGTEGTKFDRFEWIDLDEDGDPDLVTCEERDGLGVVWYENPAVAPAE